MIIEMTKTYFFTFSSPFESLNGIYKVNDIYTYGRVLDEDLDLIDMLYGPVGLGEEERKADMYKYVEHPFYLLENADTKKVYLIPKVIVSLADPDVKEYPMTMIMVDLGPVENPKIMQPLTTIVDVAIMKMHSDIGKFITSEGDILDDNGNHIENKFPPILPDTNIQIYSRKWMRSSEYDEYMKNRKKALTDLRGSTSLISYAEEHANNMQLIQQLRDRVSALEQIIIDLSNN